MSKRILYFSAYLIFCLTCFLLAFEGIYRHQLVDFYRPELRANNPPEDLREASRKTLLAMGDSFSAGSKCWVAFLRPQLPSYRIISGAIPGTGIFESLYTAPARFRQFHPQVFIYQVYVGNDLQDIRRPLNWRTMTLPRYVYGFMCSYMGLRSLTFANYRLAQLAQSFKAKKAPAQEADPPFNPATYPKSAIIYTQAEPYNLEDSIQDRGERSRDVTTLIASIRKLASYASPECRKYVVVIPDPSQVSDYYLEHFKELGGRVRDPQGFHRDDYPLITRMKTELAAADVQVLNPLPLFQARERQGHRLYYRNDSHLKSEGQALLGRFILERLEADGISP